MQAQFESAHLEYLQHTDVLTQDFKQLCEVDTVSGRIVRGPRRWDKKAAVVTFAHGVDASFTFTLTPPSQQTATDSIDTKLRQIDKLQRSVQEWKVKILANEREYTEK